MIETAVVLLNWNGLQFLSQFLQTVIEYSENENTEVWIIDNASTDKSMQYVESNYPSVRIVKLDKNYGFAEGYNKGLSQINAKYYILLNTDIEVTPLWTQALINTLKNEENTAACMPKIKSFTNKTMFEYAGAAGGFIDKYGYPFCHGRLFNHIEKDEGQYDSECEIFWATGAAFCIKSDIFHEMEGFDADFFAHMEEIDLCWRLKNAGYTIKYNPHATVYHIGGGTLPKENPFKTYLNFRNNLFLLYKNIFYANYKRIITTRICLDYVAMCRFLLKRDVKNAKAIMKAHKDFKKAIPTLQEKRQKLQSLKNHIKHKEIHNKSILFQKYILRKKRIVIPQ